MVSALTTVRNIDRLRQITQVLVKHGFGELVARTELGKLVPFRKEPEGEAARVVSFAERMRLVLQELGPTFVKLGQVLSTRADLLPEPLIAELRKLQEDVPPIPFEEVRREIEETLGAPLGEVFSSFDERPLASASIGQVHRARLRVAATGAAASALDPGLETAADTPDPAAAMPAPPAAATEPIPATAPIAAPRAGAPRAPDVDVAVKVQRPNIRATIERDLDLLYLLARLLERAVPESTIYSPTGLVAQFDRAIMAELDYTVEASHGEEFARNFAGSKVARFPRVFRAASGKKVLTAEFFDGRKIDEAVAGGYPGERIAKNAVGIIAQMIFVDGLFHADPHPGNIRILGTPAEPIIGMLDLGLVGQLSPDLREKMTTLMIAVVRGDVDDLAESLLALGRPREKVDREAFRAEVARLSAIHLGKPLAEIELAAMIRDLAQGAVKFAIEMPVEIVMVGKALMTVEGIGKSIYPALDVFEEARPFFLRLLWQRYRPEKVGAQLFKAATRFGGAAQSLPPLAAEVLDDLRRGRLRIHTEDHALGRAAERLGRRVALGIFGATLLGSGTALVLQARPGLGYAFFASAALCALGAWGRLPSSSPRQPGGSPP